MNIVEKIAYIVGQNKKQTETIDTDRAELEKLKMFKYILINKDAPYYEEITRKKRLQNIIEI